MLEKTRAIVLHSLKYGDTRFIVDVLTETHGRLTFLVPLSKSAKGKMKRQYFQPLTLLEVQFDFRANQDFQRLKNVSVSYPYGGIPFLPSNCLSRFSWQSSCCIPPDMSRPINLCSILLLKV